MHVVHEAFAIQCNLVEGISESNKLLWKHLDGQVTAFGLIKFANFTFGEYWLFFVDQLVNDNIAHLL